MLIKPIYGNLQSSIFLAVKLTLFFFPLIKNSFNKSLKMISKILNYKIPRNYFLFFSYFQL